MAATTAQKARLRRMVDEPTTATYDDETIAEYIERYPLLDERGELPYTWDTSTSPPTRDENEDWVVTYDLHAAAADVWDEKAAGVAEDFGFSADGGKYSREQVVVAYQQQARYHRARRVMGTHTLWLYPEPSGDDRSWIANLAEED